MKHRIEFSGVLFLDAKDRGAALVEAAAIIKEAFIQKGMGHLPLTLVSHQCDKEGVAIPETGKVLPPCSPECIATTHQYQSGWDTPEVRLAVRDWLEYRSKIRKPYKDAKNQLDRLMKSFSSPAYFVEAVNHSIAQGYQGCYGPACRRNVKPTAVEREQANIDISQQWLRELENEPGME